MRGGGWGAERPPRRAVPIPGERGRFVAEGRVRTATVRRRRRRAGGSHTRNAPHGAVGLRPCDGRRRCGRQQGCHGQPRRQQLGARPPATASRACRRGLGAPWPSLAPTRPSPPPRWRPPGQLAKARWISAGYRPAALPQPMQPPGSRPRPPPPHSPWPYRAANLSPYTLSSYVREPRRARGQRSWGPRPRTRRRGTLTVSRRPTPAPAALAVSAAFRPEHAGPRHGVPGRARPPWTLHTSASSSPCSPACHHPPPDPTPANTRATDPSPVCSCSSSRISSLLPSPLDRPPATRVALAASRTPGVTGPEGFRALPPLPGRSDPGREPPPRKWPNGNLVFLSRRHALVPCLPSYASAPSPKSRRPPWPRWTARPPRPLHGPRHRRPAGPASCGSSSGVNACPRRRPLSRRKPRPPSTAPSGLSTGLRSSRRRPPLVVPVAPSSPACRAPRR